MKPLLTVPRGAAWLGVTAEMLPSEMARPIDPLPFVEIGKRKMLDPDDLVAWRERRRRRSDAPPVPDRAA
jgi:hypothetical protein